MRAPASDQLLDVWDAAVGLHRLDRSNHLLRLVVGRGDTDQLGVAERDRILVELHELLFGSVLQAVAECPACGELQELEVPTADLLESRGEDVVEAVVEGYHVRCRLPSAVDLLDAAATGSAEAARELLVARSVVSATKDGAPVPSSELPQAAVAAAAAALDEADPLASGEMAVSCGACGATWGTSLDIDDYLWRKLDAWALRLLDDVHVLASAYGWSEDQIVALPPRHRQRYLELVGHG
jgi:hypothetical protein